MTDFGATALLAGSTLAGSYLQANSAERINKINRRYQEEANRISQDLANTAHQREVADLRAAGLNPILSAGGSGASTPQIGAVQAENPYNGLGNSAASVGRELARYASQQYRQGVDAMAIDNDSAASALQVQREHDQLDALLVNQQKNAIERWLNPTASWTDKKGHVHVSPDWSLAAERQQKIDKWLVDAYVSDIKLRGNANWQRNLGSVLGVLSGVSGAVNSASSAAGAVNQFRRTSLESRRQYGNGKSVYR